MNASRIEVRPPVHQGRLVALAGLVLLGLLVHGAALDGPLLLDDESRIVRNHELRRLSPVTRFFTDPRTLDSLGSMTGYQPLLPLSLALDHALAGGLVPWRLRLTNLLLLVALAVASGALARALVAASPHEATPGRPARVGLFVALLTLCHPLSGMAIHYVYTRDNLMLLLLLVLGQLAYLHMDLEGESPAAWARVLVPMVLAALAKPTAAIAPAWVLLFELVFRGRSRWRGDVWRRVLMVAAAVEPVVWAWPLWRALHPAPGLGSGEPWTSFAWVQPRVHLQHYLANFVLPWRLRLGPGEPPGGPHDPWTWACLALLAALVLWAWRARRRRPLVAFAGLAYLVMLVPSSSVHPLPLPVAHYRPLVGSLYVYLLVTLWVDRRLAPPRAGALGALVLFSLGAVNHWQARNWRSAEAQWTHSVAYGGSALAFHGLAMAREDLGQRRYFLEEALRRRPGYILARLNLGLTRLGLGEVEAGLEDCRQAVRAAPGRPELHYWLARGLAVAGRDLEAYPEAAEAAALHPVQLEYSYFAGYLALRTGQRERARAHLEQVAQRDPGYKRTAEYLGMLRSPPSR